jgi:XFP C-terminal domain
MDPCASAGPCRARVVTGLWTEESLDLHRPAVLQLSGGTTGTPKIIPRLHAPRHVRRGVRRPVHHRPVIFAYHGYPWLVHRLTYRRHGHDNLHVRGYKEEGTTTPFDMVMMNDLDRFHLVMDVIDPGPRAGVLSRPRPAADDRQAHFGPRLHPRARRGRPRDQRLEMGVLTSPLARAAASHRGMPVDRGYGRGGSRRRRGPGRLRAPREEETPGRDPDHLLRVVLSRADPSAGTSRRQRQSVARPVNDHICLAYGPREFPRHRPLHSGTCPWVPRWMQSLGSAPVGLAEAGA